MMQKTKLILTGALAATGLTSWLLLKARGRARDRKAAEFFSELERNLSPAGEGLVASNAFDIYYWQKAGREAGKDLYMLKAAAVKDFASKIQSAWGVFDDDEKKIYGVFRALKDQVQVSQVSHRYYQDTKVNLIDALRSGLSSTEVGEIMKTVNKLPPYRAAVKK